MPASKKAESGVKLEVRTKKGDGLTVPVYSLVGREAGTLSLPKELFGVKVNNALLAQAVRVYLSNQKNITASTKTRGEVHGTTAKMYRQKGTGRARHGAETAPIFVGGGVAFGPKPRQMKLKLSKKAKKAALLSALSSKDLEQSIVGISGLDKATGKTKEMANFLKKLPDDKKAKSTLIIIDGKMDKVIRAVRNIEKIHAIQANMLNAYEVLKHERLIFTKEAIDQISDKKSSRAQLEDKQKTKLSVGEELRVKNPASSRTKPGGRNVHSA